MPTIHICDRTCQVFVRILFLAFIVAIAGYFFWVNDKVKEETVMKTERFVDGDAKSSESISDTITAIYMELYSRPPNTKEMQFYTEFASDKPDISKQDLKNTIATTSPVLQKSLIVDKKYGEIPDSNTGKEYIVIDVYNEVLGRNPEPEEVAMYSKMLTSDLNFNENKLRQILFASEEYRRMEMTQSNTVHASLPNGITDRQLTMRVQELYEKVTGKSFVDEDTMRFLKKKYLEMSLDDAKMMIFIDRYVKGLPLNPIVSNKAKKTDASSGDATKTAASGGDAKKTAASSGDAKKTAASTNNKTAETFSAQQGSNSQVAQVGTQAGTQGNQEGTCVKNVFNIYGPNQSFLESISKGVNSNEDIFDNVKCATQNTFDKSALDQKNIASSTEYSKYLETRNRDYLGTVCKRNQEYRQFDNESFDYAKVLDYSANNRYIAAMGMGSFSDAKCKVAPDMGFGGGIKGLGATPLDMAQNTKVGSILPPLPPTDPM